MVGIHPAGPRLSASSFPEVAPEALLLDPQSDDERESLPALGHRDAG
jgi:hypothetical protein